jgi:hypothetical protein
MKKLISIFLSMALFGLFCCEEEETVNPTIETTEVRVTSASSFTATGTIGTTGTIPVLDYGFMYSRYEFTHLSEATKISLGASPVAGAFESNITVSSDGGWIYTSPYYVRAYITNEKGTVYGSIKSFSFPQLAFHSFSPQQAKPGDVITLYGNNFSSEPTNNIVKFNEIPGIVKTASTTQLAVEVPAGIIGYYYDSYVTISITIGSQVTQRQGFKILPSLTGFSPQSGTYGDVITIVGSNFYGHSFSVRLGQTSVSANHYNNSLTFSIPYNITSESFKVKVVIDYDEAAIVELPGEFTIIKPVISSISPVTGIAGTTVTLIGTGFTSNYYSGNTIKFGTVQASINNVTSTQIQVAVPTGLTIGESYNVTLSTSVHTVVAPSQFTMGSPSITNFSPKTASNNSYVTITGTNFSNVTGSVLFGSIQGHIYSWSNTSIQVQIPSSSYLPAGNYKITVNAGGQSDVSTDEITIL